MSIPDKSLKRTKRCLTSDVLPKMKALLSIYILSLLITSVVADNFAMQSVWETIQHEKALDQSAIQTRSWYYNKKISLSAEEAIALNKKELDSYKGLSIDHIHERE